MKSSLILLGVIIIVGIGLSVLLWQRFSPDDFNLPIGGETLRETVTLQDGQIVQDSTIEDMSDNSDTGNTIKEEGLGIMTKEIMVTDGVKHSVSLADVVGGGPPKDGIPSIDSPQFVKLSEANQWLGDDEPGIAFSRGDVHRFYPYQILVWHELVNDEVNGERILVSYCPLCLSGFVFDPVVQGEKVEFGTSGKLWKSNLVMYDRKTDTLWSQILGEAIVGELTGTKLAVLPSDQVLYKDWKKLHLDGQVLSRDTGATRFYGSNPYGSYFDVQSFSLSLTGPGDDRLANEAFTFGILVNDKAKAYDVEAVKEKGVVEDTFEGASFVLRYDQDLDVVRMFRKTEDGTEERVNPFSNFWFSWVAAHPDTELYTN